MKNLNLTATSTKMFLENTTSLLYVLVSRSRCVVTGTNRFVVIELQNSAKKYFKVGTAGEVHYGKREVFQVKDIFSRKLRFCILSLVIGFKMLRHIGVQSIFTPAFTR